MTQRLNRHLRPSEDGGFTISKELIVAVSFILLLLGALVPTVYGYAVMNEKVNFLEDEYQAAGPVHTAQFAALTAKVTQDEQEIAVLKNKLDNIQTSLNEIKSDIREIKTELNSR